MAPQQSEGLPFGAAAEPALPGRWLRPPGGEAQKALRGGA